MTAAPVTIFAANGCSATLYQGDALQVLPTLPKEGVDLLLTDPPYSSGGQFRGDRNRPTREKYQSSGAIIEHPEFTGDTRDQRGWLVWCTLWLTLARERCAPGAIGCFFSDWRQLPTATDAIQTGGWVWRGIVPWDKVIARPQPGRFRSQAEFIVWGTNGPRPYEMDSDAGYHDGVLRVRIPMMDEREHPTQKPVELLDMLVVAAPPEGIVLDPFMGSGTTAVSALRAGRNFIGCEITEEYFERAVNRIRTAAESMQGGLFSGASSNMPS